MSSFERVQQFFSTTNYFLSTVFSFQFNFVNTFHIRLGCSSISSQISASMIAVWFWLLLAGGTGGCPLSSTKIISSIIRNFRNSLDGNRLSQSGWPQQQPKCIATSQMEEPVGAKPLFPETTKTSPGNKLADSLVKFCGNSKVVSAVKLLEIWNIFHQFTNLQTKPSTSENPRSTEREPSNLLYVIREF